MDTRKKLISFGAGVLAVGLLVGGAAVASGRFTDDPASEKREEAAYTDAHRSDADVSQRDAEEAALEVHPGTVIESHLQDEGDGLTWEVKIDDGTTIWETNLDAGTGKVVTDQPDDEENESGVDDD